MAFALLAPSGLALHLMSRSLTRRGSQEGRPGSIDFKRMSRQMKWCTSAAAAWKPAIPTMASPMNV